MSETTATEDTTTTTETAEVELGDAGKKALAAERKRADIAEKSLKALQEHIDEQARAGLTELERFKQENEELRNGKTSSELKAERLQAAIDKGVPAELVGRLQGNSYDEFVADAETLVSLLPTNGRPPAPRPDLSQGAKRVAADQSPADAFAETLRKLTGRD